MRGRAGAANTVGGPVNGRDGILQSGRTSNRLHRFITEGRHEHEQASPQRSKRQRVHGFEQALPDGANVATKRNPLLKGLLLENLSFALASTPTKYCQILLDFVPCGLEKRIGSGYILF